MLNGIPKQTAAARKNFGREKKLIKGVRRSRVHTVNAFYVGRKVIKHQAIIRTRLKMSSQTQIMHTVVLNWPCVRQGQGEMIEPNGAIFQ